MKPTTISVWNCKGGVSKTVSTTNLGAGLTLLGKKVLLIDLDTQANLTHSLIGDLPETEANITEAMLSEKISLKSIVKPTGIENLYIAPAGWSMVDLELKLHSALGRESLLKRALNGDYTKQFDFILIDNGPHVGLKVINSLVASKYCLTPVSAEYLPMVGIKHLINVIDQMRPLNPSISNLGYLITMMDKREGISSDVENILRDSFGDEVFETVIRINTKFKATPQKRHTIFQAESPRGKGYMDYMNASKELLKRVGRT